MFRPSCRASVTIWLAIWSPALPDMTMQAGLFLTLSSAVRRLAGVPSTSTARCSTRRPRMPPRRLMSCQAAREPIKKSFETSCCACDTSTNCAIVTPRGAVPALPGCAQAGAATLAATKLACCRNRRRPEVGFVRSMANSLIVVQWKVVWKRLIDAIKLVAGHAYKQGSVAIFMIEKSSKKTAN